MDESVDIPRPPLGPHPRPHPKNCYRTPWGTWYVMFRRKGEAFYIGSYATMEEAVEERDKLLQMEEATSPAEAG